MNDLWFRWRPPEVGQGYSIANWKGAVAAALFVMTAVPAIVLPVLIGSGSLASFVFAGILFSALLFLFLLLVRRHSDWHG